MILVIDNNRSILQAFENVFKRENLAISTSSQPEEAVSLVSKLKPEIVILDVKINGSNDIMTLKHLKTTFPNLPVFIMTAYSNIVTRKIAQANGADEYFIKPFEIEKLLEKLKTFIRSI